MKILLPSNISADVRAFCALAHNEDELLHSLLDNIPYLQEILVQELQHPSRSLTLLNKITQFCSNSLDAVLSLKIDTVCKHIFENITPHDDEYSDEILELLKLAIAGKSEDIRQKCITELSNILEVHFSEDHFILEVQDNILVISAGGNITVEALSWIIKRIGPHIPIQLKVDICYEKPHLTALFSKFGHLMSEVSLKGISGKKIKNLISNCPNLSSLEIEYTDLSSLQGISLNNLTSLSLSHCKMLGSLPEILIIKQLRRLTISNCPHLVLPQDTPLDKLEEMVLKRYLKPLPLFSLVPNLTKLHLSSRSIDGLDISLLGKLTSLSLIGCTGAELLDINPLSQLEVLDLSQTTIETLNIDRAYGLKKLILYRCRMLKEFPDFNKHTRLEELDLSYTQISNFNLEKLSILRKLDLAYCIHLQPHIPFLTCVNITILNLEGSSIESIELRALNSLTDVSCESCTNLKSIILDSLPSLSAVRINKSSLETVMFSNLPKVTKISIKLDNLKNLVLYRLDGLVSLKMEKCPLLEILPDFAALISLRSVSLTRLKMKAFECKGHPTLASVTLSYCDFISFEITDSPNLFHLRFYQIPPLENLRLMNLPSLNTLILYCCKKVQDFSFLGGLRSLRELGISNCNLQTFPRELALLKNLKELRLNTNSLQNQPPLFESIWNFLSGIVSRILHYPPPSIFANLQNLRKINLDRNKLTTIPEGICNILDLRTLNLAYNNIEVLPQEISNLLHLRTVYDNKLNEQLKSIRGLFMLQENEGSTLEIIITRQELTSPKLYELIIAFADRIRIEHSKMNVTYTNEKGQDLSGLSKDFIGQLFKNFAAKCMSQGYPSWILGSKSGTPEMLFEAIGTILAFIIRTEGRYPIGDIFSPGFYAALKKCAQEIIQTPYKEWSLDQLESMVHEELQIAVGMKDLVKFLNAKNMEEGKAFVSAVKSLFDAERAQIPKDCRTYLNCEPGVLNIEGEEYYIFERDENCDFHALQKTTFDLLMNYCEDQLKPIQSIAKGYQKIESVWNAFSKLPLESIISVTQGNSTKEVIIASLDFINVKNDYQTWLRDWLEAADKVEIRSFLEYVVGSTAIKAQQQIKVVMKAGEGMASHTCFNTLELPQELDKAMFYFYLNGLKGEIQTYSIV
jgi:Leucine-rich repeat (LRR) protein